MFDDNDYADDYEEEDKTQMILNRLYDKIDDMQVRFDTFKDEYQAKVMYLNSLEEKVCENMNRLNDMIKEFKGLVQIIRGRTAVM